jgi:hypothetical protein
MQSSKEFSSTSWADDSNFDEEPIPLTHATGNTVFLEKDFKTWVKDLDTVKKILH